jgi:hypothetical protein
MVFLFFRHPGYSLDWFPSFEYGWLSPLGKRKLQHKLTQVFLWKQCQFLRFDECNYVEFYTVLGFVLDWLYHLICLRHFYFPMFLCFLLPVVCCTLLYKSAKHVYLLTTVLYATSNLLDQFSRLKFTKHSHLNLVKGCGHSGKRTTLTQKPFAFFSLKFCSKVDLPNRRINSMPTGVFYFVVYFVYSFVQ